jgi:hypothetical protein
VVVTEVSRPSPDDLLQRAHEASYRLPAGFAGFRAAIRFSGPAAAEGSVVVRAGERPELDIDLPEDERRWLEHELGSLVGHRLHRTYDDGDGATGKRLGADDGSPHGHLIELEDKMDSSYRVLDDHLTEITRTHGGQRFTIVIQERATAPDGRAISSAFTVIHWGDDAVARADAYSDAHVEVADVLLPARRRVASGTASGLVVRQFELDGHELLDAETGR